MLKRRMRRRRRWRRRRRIGGVRACRHTYGYAGAGGEGSSHLWRGQRWLHTWPAMCGWGANELAGAMAAG